jgi:8-oxo-dGTP pyrophosphatase MutT (NUDIX family)
MAYTDGTKPSHYACIVLWRPADNGVEFLVINSETFGRKPEDNTGLQVKFPGGMNRVDGEPPQVTGAREFLEETHLSVDMSQAIELPPMEVPNRMHVKHGYLLSHLCAVGELRSEVLTDQDDKMQPPRWQHYMWLANDPQPRAHQYFLRMAVDALRKLGALQ